MHTNTLLDDHMHEDDSKYNIEDEYYKNITRL